VRELEIHNKANIIYYSLGCSKQNEEENDVLQRRLLYLDQIEENNKELRNLCDVSDY
jgi:hypothetical protein